MAAEALPQNYTEKGRSPAFTEPRPAKACAGSTYQNSGSSDGGMPMVMPLLVVSPLPVVTEARLPKVVPFGTSPATRTRTVAVADPPAGTVAHVTVTSGLSADWVTSPPAPAVAPTNVNGPGSSLLKTTSARSSALSLRTV